MSRKEFDLLNKDEDFLKEYQSPWETICEKSKWVLIHNFPIPKGYNHPSVSIAIQIPSGYPRTQLDMVYVYPHLVKTDGSLISKANAQQTIDGKSWQRWSRHRTRENPWNPNTDSIETHIYLIEDWFEREITK